MSAVKTKILQACELAAIRAYQLIGTRSSKERWDDYSVTTLRALLNDIEFYGKIVIGEGHLDNAPLLYNGEVLGKAKLPKYDIAVDPIEGTFPASENIRGSIVTIALAKAGSMISMPEFYMQKLFTTSFFKDCIDLSKGLEYSIKKMQKKEPSRRLRCIILDKPRNQAAMKLMNEMGVIVKPIKDGDVVAAVDCVHHKSDFVYGIGSAPEGALMACLAIAVGGDLHWQLVPYTDIHPKDPDIKKIMAEETKALKANKLSYSKFYKANDLVNDQEATFIATGLTGSEHLSPIDFNGKKYETHSILATTGIVHDIKSKYNLDVLKNTNKLVKDLQIM